MTRQTAPNLAPKALNLAANEEGCNSAPAISALGLLLQQLDSKEAREEADDLYSESFRTPGFLVGSNMKLREHCIDMLMFSGRDYDEDKGEYVSYGYGLSRAEAESIVDKTRFTYLVNYKGEEEGGLEIEAKVKHLRLFYSKHAYLQADHL